MKCAHITSDTKELVLDRCSTSLAVAWHAKVVPRWNYCRARQPGRVSRRRSTGPFQESSADPRRCRCGHVPVAARYRWASAWHPWRDDRMAETKPRNATSHAPAATATAPTSTSSSSTAAVSRRRWCDLIATPAPRTRRSVARYRTRHRLASHVPARARARSAGPGRRDATTKTGAASPTTTTMTMMMTTTAATAAAATTKKRQVTDGRDALNTDPVPSHSRSSPPLPRKMDSWRLSISLAPATRAFIFATTQLDINVAIRLDTFENRRERHAFLFPKQSFTIVDSTCSTHKKISQCAELIYKNIKLKIDYLKKIYTPQLKL